MARCRHGAGWKTGCSALAAALMIPLLTTPVSAAPPTKTVTISGLTGMWTIDQADFDKREKPPYTPYAQSLADQHQKEVEGGKVISDDGLKCLPHGVPSIMLTEFALEILESPGRVTIISESSPLVRSIYLNRTQPTEGLEPMWNGYSIGHWEGGTLVVKTSNFNDRMFPLGFGGTVHSPSTTLTERFTVSNDGQTLVDELTMEDPKYLTRPFTLVRHFTRLPEDAELWEYACEIGAKGWAERFQGDSDGSGEKPGS